MNTTAVVADYIIKHKTGIQWTHRPKTIGATWNTVTGCSHESAGCRREGVTTRG